MTAQEIKTYLKPENGIETAIVESPVFVEGVNWGRKRSGHPEGKVIFHIREVLDNIDKFFPNDKDREDLRVIALVHDSFKYMVNNKKPKIDENHHGVIARRFAQTFPISHPVLFVIGTHDNAYNAWNEGARKKNWFKANERAGTLVSSLVVGECLDLYVKFYKCDNRTGDKKQDNYYWFLQLVNDAVPSEPIVDGKKLLLSEGMKPILFAMLNDLYDNAYGDGYNDVYNSEIAGSGESQEIIGRERMVDELIEKFL